MLQWGRDHLIAEMLSRAWIEYRPDWLQWGRDHLIAEIEYATQWNAPLHQLQWGRDHLIAEMLLMDSITEPDKSFNGAAIT